MRITVGLYALLLMSLPACATIRSADNPGSWPLPRGANAVGASHWTPLLLLAFLGGAALGAAAVILARRIRLRRALNANQGRPPAGELQNLQLSLMLLEKVALEMGQNDDDETNGDHQGRRPLRGL